MLRNLVGLLCWRRPPGDDLAQLIAQVEEELAVALQRHQSPLQPLRTAWTEKAAHLRTLERLLTEPQSPPPGRAHWQAIRQRALTELLATLTWVRELASMLCLARRAGAPAARAEELLAQIEAAATGL